MEVLEMKMGIDLATAIPAEIAFNFEEMEAELRRRLDHYNHLVVTEDAIKDAKDDRAALRKLKEAIETRRKEVKKQCEAPYKAFENKVKRLVALIDAPIAAIDGQVKNFEEQEREQKRGEIAAAYDELVPENIREIIPLNRILDKTWLNKSTTMKRIREEIEKRVSRTNVDMALIDGVNPKYMAAVRQKYIETLGVVTAMNYQDELIAADARFQAQEEARAQRMAQAAARQAQIPAAEEKPPVPSQEPVRQPVHQHAKAEKLFPLDLHFDITQSQANALKQFLEQNNVKYHKITKEEK